MSLLTPERVPVKVYRWDDAGAPQLDKTAGCAINIIKSCLVTGYGTKEGAGWSEPFEGTGVKVLRTGANPYTDFYLRLSSDTGREVTAQIYLNMTAANTGDLKLQCSTPFKYGNLNTSIRWVLIATTFGFWFLCEHSYGGTDANLGKRGVFFTAQYTQGSNNQDGIALLHTGGTDVSSFHSSITGIYSSNGLVNTSSTYYTVPQVLSAAGVNPASPPISIGDGSKEATNDGVFAPLVMISDRVLYALTGMFVSTAPQLNRGYDVVSVASSNLESREFIAHPTGTFSNNMFFLATDYWSV